MAGEHHTIITEREQVEEALRQSEARHRAMLRAIPDLILWFSRAGVLMDIEAPEEGPCYRTLQDCIGRPLEEALQADVAERFRKTVAGVLAEGGVGHLEYTLIVADGTERAFEARMVQMEGNGVVAIVRDITERRRLEREVLRIIEEERTRIGQDLHDGLASHLTAVAMMCRGLAREAADGRPVAAGDLAEVADLIKEGAQQARALSHGLSPVKLLAQGLPAALRELVAQTSSRSGLGGSFEGTSEAPPLPGDVANHLYRIAQEAVNNAVKHARARRLAVLPVLPRRRPRAGRTGRRLRPGGRGRGRPGHGPAHHALPRPHDRRRDPHRQRAGPRDAGDLPPAPAGCPAAGVTLFTASIGLPS